MSSSYPRAASAIHRRDVCRWREAQESRADDLPQRRPGSAARPSQGRCRRGRSATRRAPRPGADPAPPLDETRDVAARHRVAEVAAEDGARLGHQAERRDAGQVVGVRQPDGDRAPARGGERDGGLERARPAHGLEHPAGAEPLRVGERLVGRAAAAAPRSRANASLPASRSTATTSTSGEGQGGEQAGHADPAQPDDGDRSPGLGSQALSTAPPPVSTAQPSSAATSGGTSSSTGTTERRSTTAWVAKAETPRWCRTGSPSRRRREPPVRRSPAALLAEPGPHGIRPPVAQPAHAPQRGRNVITTCWPTTRSLTPAPGIVDAPARLVAQQHRDRPGRGCRRRPTGRSGTRGRGDLDEDLADQAGPARGCRPSAVTSATTDRDAPVPRALLR